jgi:phosphatidylserine decarboxylase
MAMKYFPGIVVPAYRPESEQNERLKTVMDTRIGTITITQIAGIVAKRIVPYIEPGEYLRKGQRIGIIQFGSRVDIILPSNKVTIKIRVGDKVKAGSSSIAEIK